MIYNIPGRELIEIKNVLLDYNGTIAIDGKLIDGVAELINNFSSEIKFHVLTADTYGSVKKELANVNCEVSIIAKDNQDEAKLEFLEKLGKENTLAVGNGQNDKLMLKEAIIGIALIQDEGVCVESLISADIACKSIIDVFSYFETPNRLIATLRN